MFEITWVEKSDEKYLIYLGLFLGVVDFFVSSVDLFWFFGCLKKWRRCVLLFPKMKQPPNYWHNYENFVKYPCMLYFEASIRPLVESFSDLQRQDFPHSEHLLVLPGDPVCFTVVVQCNQIFQRYDLFQKK